MTNDNPAGDVAANCRVTRRPLQRAAWLVALAVVVGIPQSVMGAEGDVIVWAPPGGEALNSADYEVEVIRGGRRWKPTTYRSESHAVDKTIDADGEYIKLGFLALHSTEAPAPEENADTYAHSWTQFDFDGAPVDVVVRMRRPLPGIILPLRSAAVLPSSLGVVARIEGDDTIRFTLNRPAKLAVVVNHDEALEQLATATSKRALEGFRNPLFIFARQPEREVPDRRAKGTLVIKPGDRVTPDELQRAKLVWFEPGVHDYSRFPGDAQFYMVLRPRQVVYLAGGAYVFGNFKSGVREPISEMPVVRGRGVLSGDRQPWDGVPYVRTVVANVRLDGVTIADPHNHIQHSIAPIRDVAVVGAWHGNTDGPTIEAFRPDPYQGWHVDDCFVMAADTNLKVAGHARVRNYVAWQLSNAEPLWMRNPDGCLLEDIHVIAYNEWPAPGERAGRQTVNLHSRRGQARNTLVRNLVIEAPFVPLLFLLPAEDPGGLPAFENVVFENVTVNTPFIAARSPVGAARAGGPPTGRIVFRNLVINGVRVTDANCQDYFELLHGVGAGREIVFE